MLSMIFSFIIRYIILNPMALAGIVVGWYVMYRFGFENIEIVYTNPYTYGIVLGIGLLYALIFQHVYKPDSESIDWWATIKSSLKHTFNLLLAAILTATIIYCLHYGFGQHLDRYLRYQKGTPSLYINKQY